MAVTKIWPIKNSFAAPIIYVQNSEKTLNPNAGMSEESLQALEDVIEYAANEDKTEMKYYVSTINCNKRCARDEFAMVKKRFGKEGGIVAFHAYQSFAPGEVNPSEAHSIGVELARRLWGDRFQIVVATHVNTAAVHNHLVINSISFKDGKRFHGCRETTGMLREMSDRICQEHGLSVIKNPKGQRVNTYLYKMERAGMPTRYNVARKSIDEAIALSFTLEEFKAELKNRGYNYRFDPQRKYSLSINDSMQCIMFLLLTLLYQIRMHKDSNYHYSNKAQKDSPYISFHQGSKVFVLYSLMDECDHI